jgi:hypothetical protein
LICALSVIASDLAKSASNLTYIEIQAAADRQEMRPETRRRYASNWALAQQRGACVLRILRQNGVPPDRMRITNAGPLYTAGRLLPEDLARDRSVQISVGVDGAEPEWVDKYSRDDPYWLPCDGVIPDYSAQCR